MHYELLPLLLITFLAAVVPFLANRMKNISLPIVVGEIIAGMLIGKSGLNWVNPTPELIFLADFGFIYLMFLSGLEMNFSVLVGSEPAAEGAAWWRRPVSLAAAMFLVTVALALAVGFALAGAGLARSGLLMGLILSTTSLGIVLPVLKEKGHTKGLYGQCLLLAALISDFVTLLLLSVAIALESGGASFNLLFILGLLVAFAGAVNAGQRVRRLPLLSRTLEELSHATAQIRVRGAFAIMVAWVFLAQKLGAEVILGAFLAGALISIISGKAEEVHRQKLEAIGYGFFIPIFFIHVGTQFDLGALLASHTAMLLVPLLVAAAYFVKLVPSLLLRLSFSWRQALGGGVLLSSRLSLIIAAAAIALNLEMISPAANAAVILTAILTCTVSPVLFTRLVRPTAGPLRSGVIIAGAEQLGMFLGERLKLSGEAVAFAVDHYEHSARLRGAGFKVVHGEAGSFSLLERAGAERAQSLVAIYPDDEITLQTCRLAKSRFAIPSVVGLAHSQESAQEMEKLGVRAVQTHLATALALEGAIHFPATFEMLTDVSYGLELSDGLVLNRALAGKPLKKVTLPGGVLVVGIRRAGEAIVPNGDTQLELDDVLTLVGKPDELKEARYMVEGR